MLLFYTSPEVYTIIGMVSFIPDWGEQITLPFSQNDPQLQIFNHPHPTSDCL